MLLDHIELMLPDRAAAAEWYSRVLRFEVMREHAKWARNPNGPLMISNDGGRTMLALFQRPHSGNGAGVPGPLARVAFRLDAANFIDFLDESNAWRQPPFTKDDVVDHAQAFSVYFEDPWGTPLEVTTYEHEMVREELDL